MVDGDIKLIQNPAKEMISDKTWKYILNLEIQHSNLDGLPEKID